MEALHVIYNPQAKFPLLIQIENFSHFRGKSSILLELIITIVKGEPKHVSTEQHGEAKKGWDYRKLYIFMFASTANFLNQVGGKRLFIDALWFLLIAIKNVFFRFYG